MKVLITLVITLFTVAAFGHGNQAHSTLGNDNNINNCNPTVTCKPRVIYMTHKQAKRIKALEAEVTRLKAELANAQEGEELEIIEVVHESEKKLNSVSLLVPYGPTGLKVERNGNSFKAKNVREWDLGLMYQRADFLADDLRGSFGVTAQGTVFGGLGIDF